MSPRFELEWLDYARMRLRVPMRIVRKTNVRSSEQAILVGRQKQKARVYQLAESMLGRCAMGAPKGNKFALGNRGGKGGPLKYDRRYAKIAALAYSAGHIDQGQADQAESADGQLTQDE